MTRPLSSLAVALMFTAMAATTSACTASPEEAEGGGANAASVGTALDLTSCRNDAERAAILAALHQAMQSVDTGSGSVPAFKVKEPAYVVTYLSVDKDTDGRRFAIVEWRYDGLTGPGWNKLSEDERKKLDWFTTSIFWQPELTVSNNGYGFHAMMVKSGDGAWTFANGGGVNVYEPGVDVPQSWETLRDTNDLVPEDKKIRLPPRSIFKNPNFGTFDLAKRTQCAASR